MLESIVDLLDGLFFIVMILLTAVCTVGSIVAALRAVSRGTATSEIIQRKSVDDMQPVERLVGAQVLSVDDVLNPGGTEKIRSSLGGLSTLYMQGKKRAV